MSRKTRLFREFSRQFQATAQLRAETYTSFSSLTIRAILRESDRSEVRFGANFKQQPSGARCFAQVLSKTANRSYLDVIDQTHPFR